MKRCGSERVFQCPSPDGPGVQRPHSDRTNGGLLTDPGDDAVHRHWLLEQRRLRVHMGGTSTERLRSRRRWYWDQVTLFDGPDLVCSRLKHVSVTRNSFGGFLPLSKRCLEENIGRLSRSVRRTGGGAAECHPTFFCWRFKRGQLEDIRGDRAVKGLELVAGYTMQDSGHSWCSSVLYASLVWCQHVIILDTCSSTLLDPLPLILLRSCSLSGQQHIAVELPLQVCMREKMRGRSDASEAFTLFCYSIQNQFSGFYFGQIWPFLSLLLMNLKRNRHTETLKNKNNKAGQIKTKNRQDGYVHRYVKKIHKTNK